MMPKRVEPRATESSTTAACRFMLLDCNHGDSTLPSSCCTAKITSITIRAPFQPTETSATRTATAPTTKAPTIGMKPPKKVSRSEEHTSELQSLMRITYAVFCLKNKKKNI